MLKKKIEKAKKKIKKVGKDFGIEVDHNNDTYLVWLTKTKGFRVDKNNKKGEK